MSKKLMSVILVAVLVLSMGTVAMASVSADELPAKADGYNRYYFYMPENWYNEYATTAGIYWWEGTDACSAWPGYVANETDVEGVYYYDVHSDVTTIIWNNAIDGGTDDTQAIYTAAYQTKNIGSEYYDVDESVNYPEGTPNFDEMIYVVDSSKTEVNEYSGKSTFAGEWFYYYGNGEYGYTPTKGDTYFNERSYSEAPVPVGPTTDEPTAPEVTGVKITVDGVEYIAQVGDVITYTTTLTTPANIENIQAYTTFDTATLELVEATNADRVPNIGGVVANVKDGVFYFNASEIETGFDFVGGKTLVSLQFKVVGEADAAITTVIEEMCEIETAKDYITGSEIVADGVAVTETLEVPEVIIPTEPVVTEPVVTEPDATSGTEAPEKEPTDVPETGANTALFVTLAVIALAAAAVVVLRKKANA